MFLWISLAFLLLSLAVMAVIAARHRAELVLLDVESIPQERAQKVKSMILAERALRRTREFWGAFLKRFGWIAKLFLSFGARFRDMLSNLELAYERARRTALGTRGKRTAQIVGLLREAEELAEKGDLEAAEKKYVAIINLDPKNVDAYEALGHLYLKMKNFEDARESFKFILKLRKDDASVEAALGEVQLAEGKPDNALPHFRKAVNRRPGNPKYLDFYIETAILASEKSEALRGLRMLTEVNPENKKIEEWKSSINQL